MSRRILYLRSTRLAMMTLVAVVLAAITVLSPGSTFSGAKASVDEDVIAKSIRFRTDLGLPADRSYVIDIESQPDALRDLGIAMTPDELNFVESRQVAVKAAVAILQPQLEPLSAFAGMYAEPASGTGLLVVLMAAEDSAVPAILATVEHLPVDVELRLVEFSLAELNATVQRLTHDREALRENGFAVTSFGVDIVANRAFLGLASPTDEQRSSLHATYGPRLDVRSESMWENSCVSRSNCASPMKGGLRITRGLQQCTSGFIGRDIAWSGAWYVITAGHCITSTGVSWSHNGTSFGTAASTFYYNGSTADAGFIVMPSVASPGNLLYGLSGPTFMLPIGAWGTNASQIVGTYMCYAGQVTGANCGMIAQVNIMTSDGVVDLYGQWTVNMLASSGDSGGAIWSGNTAYGILSRINPTLGQTSYSTIANVRSLTAAEPCTSSGC